MRIALQLGQDAIEHNDVPVGAIVVNEKGEVLTKDTLYEYDSTGVLLYFKNGTHIFILTKPDKKSIVEFFIHNLKKIK